MLCHTGFGQFDAGADSLFDDVAVEELSESLESRDDQRCAVLYAISRHGQQLSSVNLVLKVC